MQNAQNWVSEQQAAGQVPSQRAMRDFVINWCVRLQEQKLAYYKSMSDALRPNRGLFG